MQQFAQKLNHRQSGMILLLLAAAMSSIGGVCIRLSPWQPLSINAARGLIACAITFCYIKSQKQRIIFSLPVIIGGISLCCTMLFHVLANRLTSAAHAILLMYTSPIFVLLFLCIFKNKRASRQELTSVLLVLCGVVFICLDGILSGTIYGDFIGLLSGIAYAGVFLVNSGKGDALSSYFLGQMLAGLIGIPSLLKESVFTHQALSLAICLGVIQLGLAYVFMAKGLALTPPVTASVITCIEPVLCPLWVWLVLGDNIGVTVAVGALFIIASVIYSSSKANYIANKTNI